MSKKRSMSGLMLIVLVAGSLLFWTAQTLAQTEPEPGQSDPPTPTEPVPPELEEELPDAANPPSYIIDLVENTELTQDQVNLMRAGGAGWGNIRIAASLAEQIAANSAGTDTPLTFDQALELVLAARAEGLGFGEIAQNNGVKIGQLTRNQNRNKVQDPALGDGLEAEEGVQAGETVQTRGRKRGVFARLAGFLGFGKGKGPDKEERPVQMSANGKGQTAEKPARQGKAGRLERLDRPDRPSKPEKPEKPEKPAKPEKPEKPERGPRR